MESLKKILIIAGDNTCLWFYIKCKNGMDNFRSI